MTQKPKVSILIPVYNTAQYLPRCMKSVLNQTLKEIEVVVVNDASPDNAAEVLADYAAKDARINVVTHEKNGGILAARLSGIAAATGDYIICLDADDYLDTDTARAALAKAESTGADMVHFEFDVRLGDGSKPPFARQVEKALRPYNGTLRGSRVFEGAFIDELYRWNICGKFISSEVCRKAAAALPEGYYIMAEDFCFYSMLAYFAGHYEPLFKKCYYYGLDIGVSSYTMVDRKGFIKNCSVFTALNAVKTFLSVRKTFERYQEPFEYQERKILCDLLDRWEHKVIASERPWAFSQMAGHYDAAGLMRSFVHYFYDKEADLAYYMGRAVSASGAGRNPGHIALYCADFNSDFARALILTAKKWMEQRRNVTVIAPPAVKDALPTGMKFLALPEEMQGPGKEAVSARSEFWCARQEFDTVVYASSDDAHALFDMLAIKLGGKQLIAMPRMAFSSASGTSLGTFLARLRGCSLADAVALPGASDRGDWAKVAGRCHEVGCEFSALHCPDDGAKKDVLYLGVPGDESAETFLSAWNRIAPTMGAAELLLAGTISSPVAKRSLYQLASVYHLENSLRWIGEVKESSPLVPKLRLCVLMDEPEHFITTLRQLFACSVPVLDGRGKSPEELAEAIGRLLEHGEGAMSLPALPDCAAMWEKLFVSLTAEPADVAASEQKLMRSLEQYRMNYEVYSLPPPVEGDSFMPFYRVMDSMVNGLLPPASERRRFFFRAGRYIMRRMPFK